MRKSHNVLLACALGVGFLLGAAAPASAAHVSVGTARPAATGRVLAGNRYYGTGYRGYGYRYGYGSPYRYGYRYGFGNPYGYGVGYGAGFLGGGYGYAPYPAAYGRPAYWGRRPYSRPYRRAYRGPRFAR
ncbi:MAG TPA: hypothetical protein VHR97_05600 [Candidatus Baltobacteraceae bacterium]|jgi:hypothetical protein|nr:hypothetical protein [Candidatus Baltobacteraceae bacterium]